MTGISTGYKKKFNIIPCDIGSDGDVTARDSDAFELMLNPSKFNLDKKISFSEDCRIGKVGSDSKFKAIEPQAVSFDFVIDGTGVVSLPLPGADVKSPAEMKKKWEEMSVTKQLEKLSDVVCDYKGEHHQPNIVKLLWGKFLFYGRLTSMTSEYTLFKPSGDPLRASVSLAFKSYTSPKEEELEKNDSSPDMSHRVIFKEGDTLPLLCYRIYKDSAYYFEVAGYNNLVDFRNITPGTEIAFPPLR